MPEKLSPEREARIRAEFPQFPLPSYLGITIDTLEYGFARFKIKHRTELTQGMGIIHGGVTAALCDSAVAFALATMIDGGEKMLTIEMKINYTAPADSDLIAEARIIHKGKKTALGEVDVKKTDGTLAAKALVTYHLYKEENSGITA